jgi:hypothetical protein
VSTKNKENDQSDEDRKAAEESSHQSKDDSEKEGRSSSDKEKLPEPPGNLRRRAEWFQKRHGRG